MISIVVPAYNAAGVIGRCIDTVLRQTYPDFELLIIDDGSTDETAEIAAAKAAQDLFVGNCVILVLRPTPPSFMGREVLSNGIYFHIYPVRRSKCSFLLHL